MRSIRYFNRRKNQVAFLSGELVTNASEPHLLIMIDAYPSHLPLKQSELLTMVQSNYNFTLSHVITGVHAWLHGKSCRGPCHVAACTTELSHMSMHGSQINSYTAIRAVVAACPNQLDVEGIHRNYIQCTC